jgi:nicotinamidase-related amidase
MGTAMDIFEATLPVARATYVPDGPTGLLVIDEVVGFCVPGAGPLAPVAADPAIEAMVAETDRLARAFLARGWPVLAMRDSHPADRPEPPYPPHCLQGSGHDALVPELAWLEGAAGAEVLAKDCIDSVVGGIGPDGANAVAGWIRRHGLAAVVVVGICTDICVLDAVTSLLSARNHVAGPDGAPMLGALRDVVVHEPACATYDLPASVAQALGLPATAAHPRAETHHMGLYVMQARGAVIASALSL